MSPVTMPVSFSQADQRLKSSSLMAPLDGTPTLFQYFSAAVLSERGVCR